MIAFSNCKINLGLYVTEKRNDGFHNLSTLFYPLPIHDVVEIVRSETFEFTCSGIPIYSPVDQNLVVRAYRLLQTDYPQIGNVKIHLQKNIPTGAGVGGGSANASFTLKLLNDIYQLNLSTEQLIVYAAELGSDCAFFIHNQPCLATGRGEVLTPFSLDLKGYYGLIIFPKKHVSTKDAFANIVPTQPTYDLGMLLHSSITEWKTLLKNDFEKTVFAKYPELSLIKNDLYNNGAIYASMSGSGSAIFGIFDTEKAANDAAQNAFTGQYYKVVGL